MFFWSCPILQDRDKHRNSLLLVCRFIVVNLFSKMSPVLTSHGVVFATAMAAVSGSLILLAIKIQKSSTTSPSPKFQILNPIQSLRPCISTGEKKKKKKGSKRVRFAEDVVEPRGNSDEFRRQYETGRWNSSSNCSAPPAEKSNPCSQEVDQVEPAAGRRMPENRIALYNGLLRDRVKIHRLAACTY